MPEAPMPGPESADPVREEVLRAAEVLLPPGGEGGAAAPLSARALLRPLFAAVPTGELASRPPELLAHAARSLADLAEGWAPGETRLRLTPPGPGRGAHAVVEVVTDDMPFLVDSALGALAREGRAAREFLHPILGRTSAMRITLAGAGQAMLPGRPPGGWPALEAALGRAFRDTRAAVSDFPAMAALLRGTAEEMPEDATARAFVRWLLEDNFVLLGHRRIRRDGGVAEAENLGLLRDPALPVFDALADLPGMPEAVRASFAAPVALGVAKANMRSTVHRPQHADVVATRILGPGGEVEGIRLFLGLFAAGAYNRNPRSIPLLREKVDRVLQAVGLDAETHDGRALRNILDTWPRDELFQATEEEILEGARVALDLAIRPRAALHLRPDRFGRFVSAIVWLPREGFDSRLRQRVGEIVARAHNGRLSAFYIALGDSPLARIHYIVGTNPATAATPDRAALERLIASVARSFPDRLGEALAADRGDAAASEALLRWSDAFPPGYRETVEASQAAADVALAERALAEGRPAASLSAPPGAEPQRAVLRLAIPGRPLELADALPLFDSLGLRAVEEVLHRLAPRGAAGEAERVALHVFQLDAPGRFDESRAPAVIAALDALLARRTEADAFNRLVLLAGLDWREAWLLRAMAGWLKQVGFAVSPASVAQALAAEPEAARLLVALFRRRFEPGAGAERDEAALEAGWAALRERVTDAEADRVFARLRDLLDAVLRTNFFQGKDHLALKIDSARAGEMPLPRPWREIWVHSARMEGCHLRAGPVARGGIRWSDRRDDFRTEILGLMKAQRLKNVVIVPTGAKGGFVLKGAPPAADRAAFQEAGVAAYKTLVRGMLDVTDNLRGAEVLPPPEVVRRDGDDPYIVAAADKGTATFSDLANGLSAEYGFWLGDAFASGGSAGYDHKAMGITARGAWVMIERHFLERLGRSVHDAPFDVAGVGDMSGDVFGNGLLVSRQARLRAAFDHRHIFLDPDPDPARSYAERARLFALPRSSWDDYDRSLLSAGGGVFARNQKSIALPPEARAMLGLQADRAEPAEVMRAILRMECDLLYFGGIGTYVKGSAETDAEVGDRANDALRVDGRALRARVVGEGANLAVTQAGRVEAAQVGVRLNTDALDNSAGVSTSDHEVNIKILLAEAEAGGSLTRRQRDELLEGMTEEVAALVLRDNALQSLAVSLDAREGAAALPAQAALMARLEGEGVLDRALAGLPDAAALSARELAGEALTRPELAALLPTLKLWLTDAVAASDLPDDPAFEPLLLSYFPSPLRAPPYDGLARTHRLRRELVVTMLANLAANRLGTAALGRLASEGGPVAAVRAAWLASALLGLEDAFAEAEAMPTAEGLEAALGLRRLQAALAGALLPEAGPLAGALALYAPALAALRGGGEGGVAGLLRAAPLLADSPDIVRLARASGAEVTRAAEAWAEAGQRFHLDALEEAARHAPAAGPFAERARAALAGEFAAARRRLAALLLGEGGAEAGPDEAAREIAREAARAPDLAALLVALRALAGAGAEGR